MGNLCDFCICRICHVGCGSSDPNKREMLELLCVIQPQEWSNMAVPWVHAHRSVNWTDCDVFRCLGFGDFSCFVSVLEHFNNVGCCPGNAVSSADSDPFHSCAEQRCLDTRCRLVVFGNKPSRTFINNYILKIYAYQNTNNVCL